MTDNGWGQDRLFPDWETAYEWEVKEFVWPDEMKDFSAKDKERWGVLFAKKAIIRALPNARVSHRGDCEVWDESGGRGFLLPGDLDVAVDGRSPIFEVKTQAPAIRLQQGRTPPCQGLDLPRRRDYLNEANRTGRPFYVLFVWPDRATRRAIVRGSRIDHLPWPAPATSRKFNTDKKVAYWYIDSLSPVGELAADVLAWSGAPFQESFALV